MVFQMTKLHCRYNQHIQERGVSPAFVAPFAYGMANKSGNRNKLIILHFHTFSLTRDNINKTQHTLPRRFYRHSRRLGAIR